MSAFHLGLLGGQLAWQAEIGPNLVVVLLALFQLVTVWQNHKLRHDAKPNDGSTTRDAIDRIEQHVAVTSHTVAPEAELPPVPPITPAAGTPVVK